MVSIKTYLPDIHNSKSETDFSTHIGQFSLSGLFTL